VSGSASTETRVFTPDFLFANVANFFVSLG